MLTGIRCCSHHIKSNELQKNVSVDFSVEEVHLVSSYSLLIKLYWDLTKLYISTVDILKSRPHPHNVILSFACEFITCSNCWVLVPLWRGANIRLRWRGPPHCVQWSVIKDRETLTIMSQPHHNPCLAVLWSISDRSPRLVNSGEPTIPVKYSSVDGERKWPNGAKKSLHLIESHTEQ